MKKRATVIFTLIIGCCSQVYANTGELRASAHTFSIHPKVGTSSGHSQTGHKIEAVYGDLKTTIFLFEQGADRLCLITSPLGIESGRLRAACVNVLSKSLNLLPEAIVASSSHNHTIPWLDIDTTQKHQPGTSELLAWELGMDFISELKKSAEIVGNTLEPVTVEWGKAEENRITYNRRGVYANGKTYFMREEDRLAIAGEGYRGTIDPDAVVVLLKNRRDKPLAALTFFTGHPVAAYNPEKLISFGQFPQIAADKLSKHLGNIPVGFVQGCGGDINCKHMLTGTIEQAQLLGEQLGETYLLALKALQPSKRIGLQWSRESVNVPFAGLPALKSLEKDLASIDDFIKRGNAGDEDTRECVGMNFPVALSPPYRARLVELVRPWYIWAIEQHTTANVKNLPTALPLEIVVARIGDVGFVGLPYEPFVKTGLKIKQEADLPCVLTCGYTDGSYGYIPDASACDDREYMSGFFRYRRTIPPYAAPAGDACAEVAVKRLAQFAR